jgi:hypothetical protein
MLDTAQIGPLIDFIHHQKFELHQVDAEPGNVEVQSLVPDFSMKGRTAASLVQRMREWHSGLRKQPGRPTLEWSPAGVGAFEFVEGTTGAGNLRRWTIVELLSRKELFYEGQVMRHCVASYDMSCACGGTSIWSMGLERNHGRRRRVLTIELARRKRAICQIRGKANRVPSRKELDVVRRWACQEQLVIDSHLTV